MISPVVFGLIIDMTGRWDLPFMASLGLLLAGAGLLGLALAVHEGVGDGVVEAWLALVGAGTGLTTAPVVATTLTAAGERRAGLAAASVTVARELGGVVAVAGLGALAEQQAERRHHHGLARAGLAGDGRESGSHRQGRLGDDAEVAQLHLLDHVAVPAVPAGPRHPSTGRRNLRTSRSVNAAGCSRASRTG
jgi:hypothetical protein